MRVMVPERFERPAPYSPVLVFITWGLFPVCFFLGGGFHKAQLKQHVSHWRGHGNTGMPLVRGNMRCTCYKIRSNRKVCECVKRVTGFFLLRHHLTFPPVSSPFASCFLSHMEPVQSQAEYVQVSVHLCAYSSCPLLPCLC